MARRTFILPMAEPDVPPVPGRPPTWRNARRPKYVYERNCRTPAGISNNRDFCLAEVDGDEAALAEIAAQLDVVEVSNTDEPLDQEKLQRVRAAIGNLQLARMGTGRQLIRSLKTAILNRQRGGVAGAVREAVRG